jgi:periplasmic protein TonB
MWKRDGQDSAQIVVSVAAALLAHVVLAGGLGAAEHFGWTKPHRKAETVEMVIIDKPPPKIEAPPPPLPPPPPEQKPPPPPPKIAEKVPVKPKVIEKAPPPPPTEEAPPPPPAPGPETPDEAPAEPYHLEMPASAQPGGTMAVQEGAGPRGNARGTPGGKGAGGGGPADSTTNGPRVASVASVKRQPLADGDYDYQLAKDYPTEARRLGIQGQVQVRLLVDDHGRVAQAKLLKGLGYGLDERALTLAKKIKFKPAIDTNDQPVAMWITWLFNFTLDE